MHRYLSLNLDKIKNIINKITVMSVIAITMALIITFLFGCSEKIQSVDWYLEHREELKEVLKKCEAKSPEELLKDANCKNAKEANYKIYRENQRNAPIPNFNFQ